MINLQATWKHKILILVPIAIGITVFIFMLKSKTPPPLASVSEVSQTVRTVHVLKTNVTPSIKVYGTAEPERTWNAVSEVSGRIIYINPLLRDGNILPKGTELLKIDPVDYELTLVQLKAELSEIDIKEKNTQASIAIEERNLKLAVGDYSRKKKLHAKGTASQSSLDQAEQATLVKNAALQNLRNTISLIPAERNVLDAKVSQAQRDLDQTVIYAPYDIRIADLEIESNQYTSLGQNLFKGDVIDQVEISAQIPMGALPALLSGSRSQENSNDIMTNSLAKLSGLKATVQINLGDKSVKWPATVVRMSDTIDTKTRTLGIIVSVKDPYKNIQPGIKPPLVKGMFVQIHITGTPLSNQLVVPRTAVRQERVYVVNKQGRLETKKIDVLFSQNGASIIKDNLNEGDKIIVSDLIPAVDGMLLTTVNDTSLSQSMKNAVSAIGNSQ